MLFGVGQLVHSRRPRRPGGITSAEIDQVLLHRIEINLGEWDVHPRPIEAVVSDRAVQAAAQISGCHARINDESLARFSRVDPEEEARQVKVTAWRIFEFRRELGSDSGQPVDPDEGSRSVCASVTDSLLAATATLDDRTVALERYASSLNAVAAENDRQARSQEMARLGERVAFDLIPLNVAQEMAAQRLTGLRDHLVALLPPNRLDTDR